MQGIHRARHFADKICQIPMNAVSGLRPQSWVRSLGGHAVCQLPRCNTKHQPGHSGHQ
jgi:hypothetical protein